MGSGTDRRFPSDTIILARHNTFCNGQVIEVKQPKLGRPTSDPKTKQIHFRLSESDLLIFESCAQKLGLSMTEMIKLAVKKLNDTANQPSE